MHRRLSTMLRTSSSSSQNPDHGLMGQDNGSKNTVATAVAKEERIEPLPVASLKIKRVDNYYSRWSKNWKYRNTSSKVAVETVPILQSGTNEQWKEFSFVVVRTIPRTDEEEVSFRIIVKSDYILKACQIVIESWPGVSWNADPLSLDPEIFVTYHDQFLEYEAKLAEKKRCTELEANLLSSVRLLNSTIASDYSTTLATIRRLTKHREITFDLLYGILIPRTLFVARCAVTGLPRLLKLTSFQRMKLGLKQAYQLTLESVDMIDRPLSNSVGVGRVQTVIYLLTFRGAVKIDTLDVYPLKYHCDEAGLRQSALSRGNKWVSLMGVHHRQYDGVAALKCGGKVLKHNVRSRIMIDRATFRRLNTNYAVPTPVPETPQQIDRSNPRNPIFDMYGNLANAPAPVQATGGDILQQSSMDESAESIELSEEEILLAPVAVYGFSLGDKAWLEFNIDLVQDVDWNQESFANLVLPQGRKDLLQSLVESHHHELGFDDFVKGKGQGLVINLFGPPGVGKTFSAEATSEHVKRPLYIVGGGDLGTTASELDKALERVFDVATAWKAIVLIDEADVFLEQRSLHDLERNAMVAVFLRHVEYYRGILFLTTNRVKAFDEAFLSRIHVALHFQQLTPESKEKVWAAFISKAGAQDSVTPAQIKALSEREINGRQIKNAVRTAQSLAVAKGDQVKYEYITETLDAMDEFSRVFKLGRN